MKYDANATKDLVLILEAATRGSAAAWNQLVALYARRIFALAQSRCRNRDVAEEITQSVLATLAAKLGGGEYKEQGRFESWLFRMAMNRVRDHARKEKRRPEDLHAQSQLSAATHQPTDDLRAEPLDLERLRTALDKLSHADREVMALRHHGQMSFKDIAALLDEPMGTLLARHHRALRKLKDLMDHDAVPSPPPAPPLASESARPEVRT